MRVRRTLPPAAAPLGFQDLWNGLKGFLAGESMLDAFRRQIEEYFGTRHVFLTSSGKAAMYIILKAMRSLRPQKSEVLIPAYTCFSVPSAIVKAGLKVALCDVDASSLDFDIGLLGKAMNDDTLCIVPNHLFGIPSRLSEISECAKKRDIFILEDAAQAMGIRNDSGFLGTFGDAGFFSLGRGKSVTCGSGGIIVTDSDAIAGAIREEYAGMDYPSKGEDAREYIKTLLMSIFINPHLYWIPASLPFLGLGRTLFDPRFPVMKLSPMQAGLCATWRGRLEKAMSVRKEQAALLCRAFEYHEQILAPGMVPYLRLPFLAASRDQKLRICEKAKNEGLGVTQMYPFAVNEIPQIAHKFPGQSFPSAKCVAERLVTLPLHKYVNNRDRARMVRLLSPCRQSRVKMKGALPILTPVIPGLAPREGI
ncbi:MAG: DegT/DnrJ/EryC1/StrS family aminotransferase [Syntrophorhabdaceae bacterium]